MCICADVSVWMCVCEDVRCEHVCEDVMYMCVCEDVRCETFM